MKYRSHLLKKKLLLVIYMKWNHHAKMVGGK